MATVYIPPSPHVRKNLKKGTKSETGPSADPLSWNGESFKVGELERLRLSGDLMIMTAKGTKSVKMNQMPKARAPKNYTGKIVINKGTKITSS